MKQGLVFVARSLLAGFLIVGPIYLAVLLLLKAMKSVVSLVRPIALLLPESLPAEMLLSLLLVLLICFLIGMAVRTQIGRVIRERMETTLFERIPGYALIRSLTQQLDRVARRSGSLRSLKAMRASFRHLSSKSSMMGAIRSFFHLSQHLWPEQSMFRTRNVCFPSTCLSLTPLELSPNGAPVPGNLWRQWIKKKTLS